MYKKILDSMRPQKERVSFFERMEAMQNFLDKNDLMKIIRPEMPNVPISIVWAFIDDNVDFFIQQLNAFLQFDDIFIPEDQIIFVCDKEIYSKIKPLFETNVLATPYKLIGIDRDQYGNRPGLNWDIGVSFATNDRILFLKDTLFFFEPWKMIREARLLDISSSLINFCTIFGHHFSSITDKWAYLVHSKFGPTPLLFAFLASKTNWDSINGFDLVFRRGFDNLGDLDLLLRWSMKGYDYVINDDIMVLQNAFVFTPEQIEDIKLTTAIPRRYFFDRWGEDFIQRLDIPYKMEMNISEVNEALTHTDLLTTKWECRHFNEDLIKDPFTFAKLPREKFIIQE